jgi:EAL and modified HD-GYP domain-containing signal transduction protein
MPSISSDPQTVSSVSIARQPIFDDKRRLWGYELFGVGRSTATPSGVPASDAVAISVASSALIGLQEISARGRKVLMPFGEKSLLDQLPYALPPALTAVMVSEDLFGRPDVPAALEQLKADGYLIAVTGFSRRTACEPLYRLADVLGIGVGNRPDDDLAGLLEAARSWTALRMARRVSDPARFDACRKMGFDLFQGSFFKSPQSVTVRQFTSTEVSRFQLLRLIETQDPDTARLAEAIQADVALSFRLLAYLNSAAFGLASKIGSIRQAIALLGWRNLRIWLRVALLADMGQTQEAPELVLLAAQRGKFLERIAETHDFWGFDPDSLHLLGLFSLLDALLGLPMAEIVDYLPLDQHLKAALCREPGSQYTPLLRLAQSCEEARWGEAASRIQQLNMDEATVKKAFQAAIDWATGLAAPPEPTTDPVPAG